MKIRQLIGAIVLVGASSLITSQVISQTKSEEKKGDKPAMGGMSEADMKKMMEMNMPGPHHKRLAGEAGTWNAAVKSHMSPEAPWEESKGVSKRELIFDGRFVVDHFDGEMLMGDKKMPFNGMGITGYNNATKKYESLWLDSMSTAFCMQTGSYDDKTRTYTYTGEMVDCMTGKPCTMKTVIKIQDDSKHMMEMFTPGPDGKEFKCMEIVYTRK